MRVCGVLIYSADTGVVHSRVAWLLDPGATINDVNVWTDVALTGACLQVVVLGAANVGVGIPATIADRGDLTAALPPTRWV